MELLGCVINKSNEFKIMLSVYLEEIYRELLIETLVLCLVGGRVMEGKSQSIIKLEEGKERGEVEECDIPHCPPN